jgi:hypothetical protein
MDNNFLTLCYREATVDLEVHEAVVGTTAPAMTILGMVSKRSVDPLAL